MALNVPFQHLDQRRRAVWRPGSGRVFPGGDRASGRRSAPGFLIGRRNGLAFGLPDQVQQGARRVGQQHRLVRGHFKRAFDPTQQFGARQAIQTQIAIQMAV